MHGTHVCGTIAGGNASGQWIGVAPDAKLAVARVIEQEGGTDAQVLAGLGWVLSQGVDVISMSLGGLTLGVNPPDTYTTAILKSLQAGAPVVIAIGNDGSQTSGSPGNDYLALSVGATDIQDRAAGFSGGRSLVVEQSKVIPPQYLPLVYSKPDVSAPGVAIMSSVPGDEYKSLNGTSMATPHTSGALALLLSATSIRGVDPAKRAWLLQDLLIGSVRELGESGQDHRYGFGRIDVLRAIGFANASGYAV
jgi:subtilisin family serine protease